jgi:hypothetical protein
MAAGMAVVICMIAGEIVVGVMAISAVGCHDVAAIVRVVVATVMVVVMVGEIVVGVSMCIVGWQLVLLEYRSIIVVERRIMVGRVTAGS